MLVRQIYSCGSTRFECGNGILDAMAGSGGLMGHPTIVALFGHSFAPPVLSWQAGRADWDEAYKLLYTATPALGIASDLATTKFADDLTNKIIALDRSAERLIAKAKRSDEELDECLAPRDMAQNATKKRICATLVG